MDKHVDKTHLSYSIFSIFLWMLYTIPMGYSAGIPEPSIVLLGQVLNEESLLVTQGELTFTYTSQLNAKEIVVKTRMQRYPSENGDDYSYRIKVPVEVGVPQQEPDENSFEIPNMPVVYDRKVTIKVDEVTKQLVPDPRQLTPNEHRGSFERLDFQIEGVTVTPSPSPVPTLSPTPTFSNEPQSLWFLN